MIATPTTPYTALFLRQVRNGLEYALASVRRVNELDEPTRNHALSVIELGVKHPDLWQPTRELLFLIAPLIEQAGGREDWIPFLEMGVMKATRYGDLEAVGEFHFQLGLLFQLLGDYDQIEPHYRASADAFKKLPDTERHGRTLNRWAFAALTSAVKVELAMQLVERAEQLVQSAVEKGYSYMVRGEKARREKQPGVTYEWFAKSWEYWETVGNLRYIAWGLTNLGVSLNGIKQYEEGRDILHRAVGYFDLIHDPAYHSVALHNLGIAYYFLGNPQQALVYYHEALTVFRRLNRGHPLAMLYNAMGKSYKALGQWKQAYRSYELACEVFKQLNDVAQIANVMSNIAEIMEAEKRFTDAIELLRKALALLERHKGIASYKHYHTMILSDLERIEGQHKGSDS
jgi:tetratricopeptide (TPR) repeat protein